jgi:hypothetical protein
MSDKFVGQLTRALEFITDDNTTNALISILVVLCAAYEKRLARQAELGG